MHKIIIPILVLSSLFSCVQEENNNTITADNEKLELENKVQQLELDNALKDSVINESLSYFNEIKSNLEAIGVRKDEIRAISNDNEISNNDKDWILEEIQHINFLREENARKLKHMQNQVNNNKVEIKELNAMIDNLVKDIQWKDEQINMLQGELANLDREYSSLFDAYQEQARIVSMMTEEMNSVYFVYGSQKELQSNGVIEKKNGFLGIGKKVELKGEINEEYFTKINASKNKEITILGDNLTFITTHPSNSYHVKKSNSKNVIIIDDSHEFWKISKYLVVIID